ncbi:GntR family transcriptional regulator [Modicisalibacter zincidurans]|uniref:GntR family transcriptional regulator n=1 Tax=Modicisalibacter zincidurans TaxID=1178777 RepID=A0ABP9RDD8_9GAMM|nr:GntR family transcriptional regulator [Halomonas sp. IOP_31]
MGDFVTTRQTSYPTAVAQVYEAIKRRILDGSYRPHEYVRETGVAKELEVSRTPVREALRELVTEGWLEAIPHHGARVTAWTEQDAQEVFEIRLLLEPLAIHRAARHIQAAQLKQLQQLAKRMELLAEQAGDSARNDIAALNHEFHRELIRASGSQRLATVLDMVVRTSVTRRNLQNYRHDHVLRSMRHHREMLVAIEAGNAQWAENVMRAHLLAARDLHLNFEDGGG